MTLNELKELAAHWAGESAANADPDFSFAATMLLNSAQLRYGRKFLVPRGYYDALNITSQTITVPRVPYKNGLLSVFDITNKRRIPIYTPYEADNKWPDRVSAQPGRTQIVEWDNANPSVIKLWPQPSSANDYRIFYAFAPTPMKSGSDQAWDGVYPEYHEIIALAAALDYVERRLGEDSANLIADENPYGPLNAPRWLRGKLDKMEQEVAVAIQPFDVVGTRDAQLGFANSSYRWS